VTQIRTDLQDVLARSSRLKSRGSIQVASDGGVVVLRGTVPDDHERRHAESLVRLTPGVREVRNELKIQGRAAVATPAP
jgi:osmotically-inducible protein OsmY